MNWENNKLAQTSSSLNLTIKLSDTATGNNITSHRVPRTQDAPFCSREMTCKPFRHEKPIILVV